MIFSPFLRLFWVPPRWGNKLGIPIPSDKVYYNSNQLNPILLGRFALQLETHDLECAKNFQNRQSRTYQLESGRRYSRWKPKNFCFICKKRWILQATDNWVKSWKLSKAKIASQNKLNTTPRCWSIVSSARRSAQSEWPRSTNWTPRLLNGCWVKSKRDLCRHR